MLPTARQEASAPDLANSYLQCVQCLALYAVEPEELDGTPRVVGCSACLHEWFACEEDLLCGEEEALAALAADTSFEARNRREKDAAARKAVVAARGVRVEQEGGEGKMEREERGEDGGRGEIDTRFNVFVGNLSFRATEEDLYRAFSGYGAVLKCQVPADASGASKGYGFVEMSSRECGIRAIECLQGTSILGRDVSLNEARPRKEFVAGRRGGSVAKVGRREGRLLERGERRVRGERERGRRERGKSREVAS